MGILRAAAPIVIRSMFVLLAACGGSGTHAPKEPVAAAKPDPYWEWYKSHPKSPEVGVRTTRFEPPQQCGQGPYRFVVDTISAPFSESVDVTICTPKVFKGSVSYVSPSSPKKEERGFGSTQDAHHDKCRVDATVVATKSTTNTSGGTAKPDARGKPATGSKTSAAAVVELKGVVVATGSLCPDGTQAFSIMRHGYTVSEDPQPGAAPPLPRGPYVLEMWSELPNDLTGVSLLVEQRGVPAGYKLEDWRAYREAYRAWYERRDEALAASRAQGHKWTTVEPVAATPQPPPARAETQPPRPSANASWTPGYWQFTNGWVWSAGFWRVPQKDVEQERTVEAPAPPPTPRVEAAPDVAYYSARRAVWTPGHWMWSSGGYVWIAGSWRIPESTEMTWVAPAWRPTRRGTLMYVPGGFVRIKTRR